MSNRDHKWCTREDVQRNLIISERNTFIFSNLVTLLSPHAIYLNISWAATVKDITFLNGPIYQRGKTVKEFLCPRIFRPVYRKYCDNSGLAFRYVLLSRANALYDCADKKRKTALARGWPGLLARGRWQKRRGGHAPCICAYNPQLVLRCALPRQIYGTLHVEIAFPPYPNHNCNPLLIFRSIFARITSPSNNKFIIQRKIWILIFFSIILETKVDKE